MEICEKDICCRIKQIRVELAGARGKASFARDLDISPTTYQSYEQNRVPPADVLVRIADFAEVSLRWLLTGESGGGQEISASHPVLQRAAKLLSRSPEASAPLAAFIDILSQSMKFPEKGSSPSQADVAEVSEVIAGDERTGWIPILGRSAAGVPHFWTDEGESAGLTTLDELIARHVSNCAKRVMPAQASADQGEQTDAVQLITLSEVDAGTAEFVASAAIKNRYGDAFAVRIDGESMSPDIRHGDVVILSPSQPAVDGRAAVLQLKGQIGVTCKLYRRNGDNVHLVPINEQYQPQTYLADQLVWALRVLARVRAVL